MRYFVLVTYIAVPIFALKTVGGQPSSLCQPMNVAQLEQKLKDIGGFNKEVVAFDKQSARKNLMKAMIKQRFHKKFNTRRKSQVFRHSPDSRLRDKEGVFDFIEDYIPRKFMAEDEGTCLEKGSVTMNGNLNICKHCTVTTTLPPDRFPQFITETICSPTERTALADQGVCVERIITLPFLKRSETCTPQNDGTFSENWESYQQRIRVGCECEIRQGSYLTPLLK